MRYSRHLATPAFESAIDEELSRLSRGLTAHDTKGAHVAGGSATLNASQLRTRQFVFAA
jgi:hypothetical protein